MIWFVIVGVASVVGIGVALLIAWWPERRKYRGARIGGMVGGPDPGQDEAEPPKGDVSSPS